MLQALLFASVQGRYIFAIPTTTLQSIPAHIKSTRMDKLSQVSEPLLRLPRPLVISIIVHVVDTSILTSQSAPLLTWKL